jgi:hypothetical protein
MYEINTSTYQNLRQAIIFPKKSYHIGNFCVPLAVTPFKWKGYLLKVH